MISQAKETMISWGTVSAPFARETIVRVISMHISRMVSVILAVTPVVSGISLVRQVGMRGHILAWSTWLIKA